MKNQEEVDLHLVRCPTTKLQTREKTIQPSFMLQLLALAPTLSLQVAAPYLHILVEMFQQVGVVLFASVLLQKSSQLHPEVFEAIVGMRMCKVKPSSVFECNEFSFINTKLHAEPPGEGECECISCELLKLLPELVEGCLGEH